MDANECTIAKVGKDFEILFHKLSYVPRKQDAGGQCLYYNSYVFNNGIPQRLSKTKDLITTFNYKTNKMEDNVILSRFEKEQKIFEITTERPIYKIKATPDHTFFLSDDKGISEKTLSDLKLGDFLIIPTCIPSKNKLQCLQTLPYYQRYFLKERGLVKLKKFIAGQKTQKIASKLLGVHPITLGRIKNRKNGFFDISFLKLADIDYKDCTTTSRTTKISYKIIPNVLSQKYAEFLGYLTGDGSIDKSSLKFYDRDKETLITYQKLFGGNIKFRKSCYEMKIGNTSLINQIKGEFPNFKKYVPEKVMNSPNNVLAGYLRGLFDAEGYISHKTIALSMNNKQLMEEVQLLLLRFGILSSISEYDCRASRWNKNVKFRFEPKTHRFTISLIDTQSISLFKKYIGFNAPKESSILYIF